MLAVARRAATVALALTIAFSAVRPGVAADERAFFTLTINGDARGDVPVVLRANDVLVRVSDLADASVGIAAGIEPIVVAGEPYVSLRALEPAIRWSDDTDALTLTIDASAAVFGTHTVAVRTTTRPADAVDGGGGYAYVNYALAAGSDGSRDASFEAAAGNGPSRLAAVVNREPLTGAFHRATTTFTHDDRRTLVRTTIGDAVADPGALAGGYEFAGVAMARRFALDPYLGINPQPSLQGSATTPTTADVYVNGTFTKRIALPPGQFNLTSLPVPSGRGDVQVVLRDAFGRQSVIGTSFYGSTRNLRAGLTDFSAGAGLLRADAFGTADAYRQPLAYARVAHGFNDALTASANLEASAGVADAGFGAAWRTRAGNVGLDVAASDRAGGLGGAFGVHYDVALRTASFSLDVRKATDAFASVRDLAGIDRERFAARASASFAVKPGWTLSASVDRHIGSVTGSNSYTGIASDVALGRDGFLTANVGRANGAPVAALTYARRLGERRSLSVSSDGARVSTQLQQTAAAAGGVGYRVSHDSDGTTDADVQVAAKHGVLELVAAGGTTLLRATGSLVAVGGRLFAAQAVGDAFALFRAPGLAHARVYRDNQEIGRTDAHGDFLVTGLSPNYANRLSAADLDAPPGLSLDTADTLVAPPDGGGAIAVLKIRGQRIYTGRLVVVHDGAETVPAYGEVHIDSPRAISEIGGNGEIYFDQLAAGRYAARVNYRGGSCAFTLVLPNAPTAVTALGTVRCER